MALTNEVSCTMQTLTDALHVYIGTEETHKKVQLDVVAKITVIVQGFPAGHMATLLYKVNSYKVFTLTNL